MDILYKENDHGETTDLHTDSCMTVEHGTNDKVTVYVADGRDTTIILPNDACCTGGPLNSK